MKPHLVVTVKAATSVRGRMLSLYDDGVFEEVYEILRSDDKERFVPLLSEFADNLGMYVVEWCASYRARKCLLAMIQDECCISAHALYAEELVRCPETCTPLACVASHFPEAYDIIELLLKRGPLEHANIKCALVGDSVRCPLDHLLLFLSYESHIYSWTHGDSLYKLIILICQWNSKAYLRAAGLLLPYTNEINNIALSYVKEGNLSSLAALLLVARQNVFVPFDSGLTIRQCISNMLDALSSEADLDDEGARYQSVLLDACKLLDIFEIAGDDLNLYCSSMHEYVSPDKVLFDIVSVFKKFGFVLQPLDIDLRDSFRKCPKIYNAGMFKLLDLPTTRHNYNSLPFPTRGQGFGATHSNYPTAGECQLLQKYKCGPMLNMASSASMPRLLTTAVGHINDNHSCVSRKYLAYIAFRLKRGFKL